MFKIRACIFTFICWPESSRGIDCEVAILLKLSYCACPGKVRVASLFDFGLLASVVGDSVCIVLC